jgi:hypothetical protein
MIIKKLPRAVLIGAAVLCLSASAAFADFGSVVSSFAVKAECIPAALAYNGSYVVSSDPASYSDGYWKVWSEEGSILYSFLPPKLEKVHEGAAFDGTDYWGASVLMDRVYRMTTTGSVITTFSHPYAYGLTWDGRYLWTSDGASSGNMIRQVTTAGSVVSSFAVPSQISFCCDLGWDGVYLWCPDTRGYVYRLTTAGSIVASFDPPGNRNRGCTFDGTYLRVSCFPGSGPWNIYTIDIGPAPAVEPASFGQVKAVFR